MDSNPNPQARAEQSAPVAVLGLGNVLMRDDALGPYVIQRLLAHYDFPPEVSVEDLGTPGLDLHPHLAGRRAVVLVDTVRATAEPGALRLYAKDDLLRHAPGPRTSPHDPGVKEALLALELAGDGPPDVLLVGVVPADVGYEVGLTAAVRNAIPAVETAVLHELERLGCRARPAALPRDPDLWWERSGDRPERP